MSSSFFKLIIGLVLLAALIQPIAAEACSFCEFINLSKGDPGPQGPQGEMNQTPGTTSHNLLLNLTQFDDHPQYPNVSGRAGGQTIQGGISASDALTLNGSANNGNVIFQPKGGYAVFGFVQSINHNGAYPTVSIFSNITSNRIISMDYFKNDANGPIFYLGKSKSDIIGTFAYPGIGEPLGEIWFGGGYPATSRINVAARISGITDDVWSNTNMGTRLSLYTTNLNSVTPSEKMRLTANGTLLIGATTTNITGSGLDVVGATTFRNCSGTPTMDTFGQMTCASDPKLKTAVQPYISDTAKVASVAPIKYKWNSASGYDTTHTNTGFDAEQIKLVYPECVIARDDMRYEQRCTGKEEDQVCDTVAIPIGTQTLALDDKCLIAVLWNAVIEQQQDIKDLKEWKQDKVRV